MQLFGKTFFNINSTWTGYLGLNKAIRQANWYTETYYLLAQ